MTTRVYLSLGSNVDPEKNLRAGIAELRARFGAIVVSPVYRYPAVAFEGPDFLNLAAGIDTGLEPQALNDWLHALEDRHGRRRDVPRYSSRTLDIDIVLYGERVIKGNGLEVPGPIDERSRYNRSRTSRQMRCITLHKSIAEL